MKIAILTALMILAMPAFASAADKCANAEDQATMNQCADAAFKQSDKKLNALYKQIVTRLRATRTPGNFSFRQSAIGTSFATLSVISRPPVRREEA